MTSKRCPHGCARCRAIELGYGGRGLTRAELIEVSGLVVPTNEHSVRYSEATIAAGVAVDLAAVEVEDARREHGKTLQDARRGLDRLRPGGLFVPGGRDGESDDRVARVRELEVAVEASRWNLAEVEARLVAVRREYLALAQVDSDRHRVAQLSAARAEADARRGAQRDRATRARRVTMKGFLERIGA